MDAPRPDSITPSRLPPPEDASEQLSRALHDWTGTPPSEDRALALAVASFAQALRRDGIAPEVMLVRFKTLLARSPGNRPPPATAVAITERQHLVDWLVTHAVKSYYEE